MAVNFSDGRSYDEKGTKIYLNREEFEKYVGDGFPLDGANYGKVNYSLIRRVTANAPSVSFTFQYSNQKCFTFIQFTKTLLETKGWFRGFFSGAQFHVCRPNYWFLNQNGINNFDQFFIETKLQNDENIFSLGCRYPRGTDQGFEI